MRQRGKVQALLSWPYGLVQEQDRPGNRNCRSPGRWHSPLRCPHLGAIWERPARVSAGSGLVRGARALSLTETALKQSFVMEKLWSYIGSLRFLWVLGLTLLTGWGLLPEYLQAQTAEDNPAGELQEQFEADSTRPSSSADLVSVEVRLAATPVPSGRSVKGALVLDVEEGWHVNAHRPTYDYLIGTTLEWTASSDVRVHNLEYPTPERFHFEFADDEIDVYQDSAPIFFDVAAAPNTKLGERRVHGRLRVQACNDRTCLQPSTIRSTLTVPVAGVNETPTSTGDPIFEQSGGKSTSINFGSVLRRHGLFLAGGALVFGTVLFLLVYGTVQGDTDAQSSPSQ